MKDIDDECKYLLSDLHCSLTNEFVQLDEKEYIWYKLCCYYHAKTEIFDRGLTELRSPYDPTEAYIDGRTRSYSNAYALKLRKFIKEIIIKLNIPNNIISINFDYNKYHFSAQGWIDEYYRLHDAGEMDFIEYYIGGTNDNCNKSK